MAARLGFDEQTRRRRVRLWRCRAATQDGQSHVERVAGRRHAVGWQVTRASIGPDPRATATAHRRETCRSADSPACTIRAMDGVGAAADALARVQLFAGLDRTALERLASGLRTRRFRRGEVLFHQGDPGDSLFIVTAGAVKILLPSEEGDEAILATVRPGAFFGELALLDGAPRSATAVALEPTETLVLPRDRFRLADRHRAGDPRRAPGRPGRRAPPAHRPRRGAPLPRHDRPDGRAPAPARQRIRDVGRPDGTIRLDGPYTQGDLASMIGATRQSVNKLLGQFVDDGLIRIERGRDRHRGPARPGAHGPPLASRRDRADSRRRPAGRPPRPAPPGTGRARRRGRPCVRRAGSSGSGVTTATRHGGIRAARPSGDGQPDVGAGRVARTSWASATRSSRSVAPPAGAGRTSARDEPRALGPEQRRQGAAEPVLTNRQRPAQAGRAPRRSASAQVVCPRPRRGRRRRR